MENELIKQAFGHSDHDDNSDQQQPRHGSHESQDESGELNSDEEREVQRRYDLLLKARQEIQDEEAQEFNHLQKIIQDDRQNTQPAIDWLNEKQTQEILQKFEEAISLNQEKRKEHQNRPELFEESEADLYSLLHEISGIGAEGP